MAMAPVREKRLQHGGRQLSLEVGGCLQRFWLGAASVGPGDAPLRERLASRFVMGRIAIVVACGVIGLPQSAATQARGSVQATAIVVDVRVQRRKNRPRDLIVTIEYSRN